MSIHRTLESVTGGPSVPAPSRTLPGNVHEILNRHMFADGYDLVLDMDRSHGVWLHDSAHEREFLDFFSFFASNPIGMNHPGVRTTEFIERIGQAALHKPSNSDIYTVEMADFVKTFFRVAVPEYFRYSFYIEGGAAAVENALKVAFDWKVRKNFRKGYAREVGHKVLHFRHAFHGRSGYTLSLTNTDPAKTDYFPKFTGWPRIEPAIARFPLEGDNLERTIADEERALGDVRKAFADNADEIACIIIEPIQAEGGDNHFRPAFLSGLRAVCDEHDALLIFDEVQTGVGLTGSMWAHQALGVIPDVMVFGKKTQVCGILVTERIDDIPENVFHTHSRINSTWGGNLVDMVRFTRILEIIEAERLVENAGVVGAHLLNRIDEIDQEFPSLLSNARGRGLLCAFDLPTMVQRDDFRRHCYDHGLIVIPCGSHSIRFRPPLTITADEIDAGFEIMRVAAREISR